MTILKHINLVKIPINRIKASEEGSQEMNEILSFIKELRCQKDPPASMIRWTPSGGISIRRGQRFPLYGIKTCQTSIEVVILIPEGQFRFIFGRRSNEDGISGREAYNVVLKTFKDFGIKIEDYAIDNGKEIKKEIVKPRISTECGARTGIGRNYQNVHHLDFCKAYWANIIKEFPELREPIEFLGNSGDKYFKEVLARSQGFFQSKWCNIDHHKYALAHLAKAGVNGTRKAIDEMVIKLQEEGRMPLLTNTDGIWYYGDIYHDDNEGHLVGQFKNDHVNCTLNIKSSGAYQFIEDGKVNVVVRGKTKFDLIKPDRSTWEWNDIYRSEAEVTIWTFDEENLQIVKGE